MTKQLTIISAAAFILVAVPFSGESYAEVFMLKDSRGIIYFSDTPPAQKSRAKIIKRYKRTVKVGSSYRPASYKTRSRRYSFSSRYDHLIRDAARRYNLDPMLIKAVIKAESDFNRWAVSSKGAKGLMQLMPGTARDMRVRSVFDPKQNINGGARYLRLMYNRFGGNSRYALAAYNAGPTAVKNYRGVPPFPETRRYVRKVHAFYRMLSGGSRLATYSGRGGARTKSVVYSFVNRQGSKVYSDTPR